MLAEERFAMILDLLAQKRSATVLELCDALDASESTIRRDLTQLDRQGLLKKVHGGATLVGRTVLADEPPMAAREEQSVEEKRLIARAAAAMITEKDFIFLDAGSTTLALAAALVVATNDASSLRDAQHTVMELDRFPAGALHLVVNRVRKKLLRQLHATIDDAIDKAGLPLLGVVPEDDALPLCMNRGVPILLADGQSAATAYRNIAKRLQGERVPLLRIR